MITIEAAKNRSSHPLAWAMARISICKGNWSEDMKIVNLATDYDSRGNEESPMSPSGLGKGSHVNLQR